MPAEPAGILPACRNCGGGGLRRVAAALRNSPGAVLHCPSCDLGMLEDFPRDQELAAFYDEEYRRSFSARPGQSSDPERLFADYKDYQAGRIARLTPYLKPDARLLEIGCSAGMFLHHAAPLVKEAFGIDFDSASAAHAARVSGAKTFSSPLPKTGLPKRSFDVICLFQTLEHIPRPAESLREVARWLRPGGTVCVEVPNLNDPLLTLYDVPAYRNFYYHSAHLWYFSPKSLRAVLESAGFKGEVQFVQDYNFLNHLHWHHRNAPQPSNRDGMGPARLPLSDSAPAEAREALSRWAAEADAAYKAVLAAHRQTENIAFIGNSGANP